MRTTVLLQRSSSHSGDKICVWPRAEVSSAGVASLRCAALRLEPNAEHLTCNLCSENWPRLEFYPGMPCSEDDDTPSNPAGCRRFPETASPLPHSRRTTRTSPRNLPMRLPPPPFRVSLIKRSLAGWSSAPTAVSPPGTRGQICGFTLLAGLDSFPQPPRIASGFSLSLWASQNVDCTLQGSSWLMVVR